MGLSVTKKTPSKKETINALERVIKIVKENKASPVRIKYLVDYKKDSDKKIPTGIEHVVISFKMILD